MRLPLPSSRPRVTDADITSLVDVVFLLIIFFLTTSTLVRNTVADLELPVQEGSENPAPEDRNIVINVLESGEYLLEGAPADLPRVLAMIGAEHAAPEADPPDIIIRADKDAQLAPVNALAQGLIDLGIQSWKLAAKKPNPIATP